MLNPPIVNEMQVQGDGFKSQDCCSNLEQMVKPSFTSASSSVEWTNIACFFLQTEIP